MTKGKVTLRETSGRGASARHNRRYHHLLPVDVGAGDATIPMTSFTRSRRDMKASKATDDNADTAPSTIRIVEDMRATMKANKRRNKTWFFHAVKSGNTTVVGDILRYLNGGNFEPELRWIFYARKVSTDAGGCSRFTHALFMVLSLLSAIVLTPVFYVLHRLCICIHEKCGKPVYFHAELPLWFALMSEEKAMVRLFLCGGASIEDQDSRGNNVYHYLAELSSSCHDLAVQCHKLLLHCAPAARTAIQTVIAEQENDLGMTSLEYCARLGSMRYFWLLSMQEGVMSLASMVVGKNYMWLAENPTTSDLHEDSADVERPTSSSGSEHQDHQGKASEMESNLAAPFVGDSADPWLEETHTLGVGSKQVVVRQFDTSRYEQGDALGRQSLLLRLIACRHVEAMEEEDINAIFHSRFLIKWMARKIRGFAFPVFLSHCYHLVFTALFLVFLLHFGVDINPYPLMVPFLKEYFSVVIGTSTTCVTQTMVVMDYMQGSRANYTRNVINATNILKNLLADIKTFGVIDFLPCERHVVTIGAVEITNCSAIALTVVNATCQSPVLSDEKLIQATGISLLAHSDTVTSAKHTVVPILMVAMIIHIVANIILRIVFLYRSLLSTPRRRVWDGMRRALSSHMPGSYTDAQLSLTMYTLFIIYLVMSSHMEIHFRLEDDGDMSTSMTLLKNMSQDVTPVVRNESGTMSAEDHKVMMTKMTATVRMLEETGGRFRDKLLTLAYNLETMSYILIACLILRIMLMVHVMRLLPSIGFFVVTIRRMSGHLLHFAAVYILVSMTFAIAFHLVMRDPQCPACRMESFRTMPRALFATHAIALGQGDYNFEGNTNGKVVFAIYTVITVILLLNLIIATMSTTADSLSQQPRKDALCRIERWQEFLGAEAAVCLLLAPFRSIHALCIRRQGVNKNSPRRVCTLEVQQYTVCSIEQDK